MKGLYSILSRAILGLSASLLLAGCVSHDISDLEGFVEEVLARPGGHIKPLPEIKPYEAYAYQSAAANAGDPFRLFYQQIAPDVADAPVDDGLTEEMVREIRSRNRDELEQFELDSLRMVGTLEDTDENWGIIQDPDGTVHRVKVGNYLGVNIGKIINIFEDRIELREIIQDSRGRWEERQAAIALFGE
jgi:type IV pilus assembly protein PilP